ncbi:hypothetical protein JTE90_005719 [Oedothorax gibbosus]|uniref:RRM domain-containing protein n=1 Tax=Oedothorax gibbosus TaxID=931172 RepID=A0AAV6UNE3_9ARAC|nr:hypothetical protein JTE90_005719 [Oedothorax gibbosus]
MCALYVGNLHPDCNEATLYQKFSRFGKLQNVHICRDFLTRQSLGYGYVNFFLLSEAENAISSINYDAILGKPIRVMWAKNKDKKFNVSANLFVKNIHPDIDERILHDIFSSYGGILSLKIAKRDAGGNQEVAGYVQFEDEESADMAIKSLNGKLIHGQVISVTKYKLKKTSQAEMKFNNVYLKNFGSRLKDDDLIEMCRKFGSILSAKVMTEENGDSKGFGFVSFKDPDSAKEAVENLNGFILGDKKLFAGRAKKKAEREAETKAALLKKIRNFLSQTT